MSKRHKIKITLNSDGTGQVEIDGIKLAGVTAINVDARVHSVPTVTLDLLPESVKVTAAGDVVKRFVSLNRTPPAWPTPRTNVAGKA